MSKIYKGDFVSVAVDGSPQTYRVTDAVGTVLSLRLVNGYGPAILEGMEETLCRLEYRDPHREGSLV